LAKAISERVPASSGVSQALVCNDMFRYFGFGSNMNMISLRAKGVEPIAAQRAVLPGWRLRFNVQCKCRRISAVICRGPIAIAIWA